MGLFARLLCCLALVAAGGNGGAAARAPRPADGQWLVYFGTYTGPGSQGIYVSSFDAETGRLGPPRLAAPTENPSFLALHPSRPLLYAVNEVAEFQGQKEGSVSAYAIDPGSGDLRPLGRVSSRGAGPCHLSVDKGGRHVLVANYGGGSVASLPLRRDGGLEVASSFVQHQGASVDSRRQTAPHAHMVETDGEDRLALVADLGLDRVLLYRFDAGSGRLEPSDPPALRLPPGSGPRHFAFSPDGRHLYVLSELTLTITALSDAEGHFSEVQTLSSLPAGTQRTSGDSGAEIVVHPSGRFVYASLRGPDTLAVFARDPVTGKIALVEHVGSGGKTPRSFGIDPSGRFLLSANQRSDQVAVLRIDPDTGRLSPTSQVVEVGAPVSVAFFRPR